MERYQTQTLCCLIILTIIGSLWRAFPHLLVPRPFPSDECSQLFVVNDLIKHNGISPYFFYRPQLLYYLIFFIYTLTTVDWIQLSLFINPIIGGLTVIPFYYFVSKVLSRKDSLIASVLFTFSEAFLYRSAFFGTTEPLGVFFMFLFFASYFGKKYIPAFIILVAIPFTHLLPFTIATGVVVLDLFVKKRYKLVFLFCLLFVVFLFNPYFSPQASQLPWLFSSTSILPSESKLSYFGLGDVIHFFPYFLGTILMLLTIFNIKKWLLIEKELFVVALVGGVLSLLFYETHLASPMRLISYTSIPFILTSASITRKNLLVFVFAGFILSATILGGVNNFTWYSDAITQNEINAIADMGKLQFFDNKGYIGWWGWYCDEPIKEYIEFLFPGKVTNETMETSLISFYTTHVFLSQRMKELAFFQNRTAGKRTIESRFPVIDIWTTNSSWTKAYEKYGVVVYERKS